MSLRASRVRPVLLLALVPVTACGPPSAPPEATESAAALDEPLLPPTEVTPQAWAARPRPRPLGPELRPAIQAIGRGRLAEARAIAEARLATDPTDGQAAFLVGLSFHKAGNHGAAHPWFERALRDAPDYFIVHDYLAFALYSLGDLSGAQRHYEAFRAVDPHDPKPYYGLGLVALERNEDAIALARFRAALAAFDVLERHETRLFQARACERADAHARIGGIHFARGEHTLARKALEQATALCPTTVSPFHVLSLVYRRLGEERLAREALERYEAGRSRAIGSTDR